MAQYEQVYEKILSRVARDELAARCRDVAQKDARLVERRVRGAARALQHALDVEAARQRLRLPVVMPVSASLVREIDALQAAVAERMREMQTRVLGCSVVGCVEPPHEPVKAESPSRSGKKRRRRLSADSSVDAPLKPPRPGRLTDEPTDDDDRGPHHIPNDDDDDDATEDEVPLDIDVLDSDTEAQMAEYLVKARRLRKISSDRRMGELPGLIHAVLRETKRHEWLAMPRDLLGTLSATFGAATTLKETQRQELSETLGRLREVALQIDDATARRYPTLRVSTARFLASVEDLSAAQASARDETEDEPVENVENVQSATIEELHAATLELAGRMSSADDAKSMEEIEDLLTRVDHVFDNPTLARSRRYNAMVAASLTTLLKYVDAIPRNTRSKLQCLGLLHERLAQLTGIAV